MFEYVCERIIPGCSHTAREESREKLMEPVAVHLEKEHPRYRHDERIPEALKTTGITFIRPA